MKKRFIGMVLGTMATAMLMTACGAPSSDSNTKETTSEVVAEESDKNVADDNEKDTDEATLNDTKDTSDSETKDENKDVVQNTEEMSEEEKKEQMEKDYEEFVDNVTKKAEEAKAQEASTESTQNNTSTTEATTATTEDNVDHRYDGLAVANCHSVTLPKGTSYNDAMDAITKGTSAYPKTFPYIYDVDFNKPGTYQCYWATEQEDGSLRPLDYAKFTVTITNEKAK